MAELTCSECGMVRETSPGAPCADQGCSGTFAEPPPVSPPARAEGQLVRLLGGRTLRLPADRAKDLRFPPGCVACGQDARGEKVRLGARTWSFMGLVPDRRVEVEVPACFDCGRSLVARRWTRAGVVATALMLSAVGAYLHLDSQAPLLRKLGALGAGLVAALAAFLSCERILPVPLDVDAQDRGRTIELDVRDPAYAITLMTLNPWVEVEGG